MKQSDRRRRDKRRSLWTGILWGEAIVCYLAILTLISHVCGPVQYQRLTAQPVLVPADFTATNYEGTYEITGETIPVKNDAAGAPAVYAAELTLSGIERISVSFWLDCPETYAGTTLHVDLWGENYDSDEQEYQAVLTPGVNQFSFFLEPGENAPEQANLRIFTLEPADYAVQDLEIFQMEPKPKVSLAMGAIVAILIGIWIGTVTVWILKNKNLRSIPAKEIRSNGEPEK